MIRALTNNEKFALCLSGLFLIASGLLFRVIEPQVSVQASYTPQDIRPVQQSALARIFQEFRLTVGDILWLKTDEYIHSGVIYRSMTPEEILRQEALKRRESGKEENHHHEHSHGEGEDEHFSLNKVMGYGAHHHEHVIPVIPHKDVDFRGILGDIERAVKPYTPTHIPHKGLNELIPWYRLMTLANPHHIRGYVVGAYFIYTYGKRPKEALKFLQEGERNNPQSPEIKEALGRFYFYKFHQPAKAIPYYKEAIALYNRKMKSRKLTEDEQELHRNAYVSLVMAYIQLKDLKNAEKYFAQVNALYPGDRPVRDVIPHLKKLRKELRSARE
ncbi:hypothetical protein J7M23_00240 [Candidatus Sumerlaeota bacterium]|nr:hypothetical protein [Candidatus Sumerlaeota bacterium]